MTGIGGNGLAQNVLGRRVVGACGVIAVLNECCECLKYVNLFPPPYLKTKGNTEIQFTSGFCSRIPQEVGWQKVFNEKNCGCKSTMELV